MGTGELSGEGVILLGPGRDQRPQRSVGGKDAMVTVTVDAGRRENLGQAVQELQGREAQGGAAGEVGPWEEVEDLIGTVVDQVEAVEGEGRPSTIPDEPFEAFAVGGLDTDAGVKAEPATVIPAEHLLGVVGLQEAVTTEVAEHPTSHGVLEALQELVGEGGGFVEAKAGFRMRRILSRVTLHLLEEPVHDAEMIVKVRVQRRAETMEEADGSEGGGAWSCWTGLPESGLEGPKENMKDGAGGSGSVMKVGAQALGDGQDPLAHRDVGKDVVHQMGRGLGHALGVL